MHTVGNTYTTFTIPWNRGCVGLVYAISSVVRIWRRGHPTRQLLAPFASRTTKGSKNISHTCHPSNLGTSARGLLKVARRVKEHNCEMTTVKIFSTFPHYSHGVPFRRICHSVIYDSLVEHTIHNRLVALFGIHEVLDHGNHLVVFGGHCRRE